MGVQSTTPRAALSARSLFRPYHRAAGATPPFPGFLTSQRSALPISGSGNTSRLQRRTLRFGDRPPVRLLHSSVPLLDLPAPKTEASPPASRSAAGDISGVRASRPSLSRAYSESRGKVMPGIDISTFPAAEGGATMCIRGMPRIPADRVTSPPILPAVGLPPSTSTTSAAFPPTLSPPARLPILRKHVYPEDGVPGPSAASVGLGGHHSGGFQLAFFG